MEQRAYQKWTRVLLLGLVLVLTACAAIVYRVDPCFYYRMPTDREPVFFSERYQTAGYRPQQPGGRGAAWLLHDRQLLRQSA